MVVLCPCWKPDSGQRIKALRRDTVVPMQLQKRGYWNEQTGNNLCYFFLMNGYSMPLLKTCQWTENQRKREREKETLVPSAVPKMWELKRTSEDLCYLFQWKVILCHCWKPASGKRIKALRKRYCCTNAAPKLWVLKRTSFDDLCYFFSMNGYSVPLLETCQWSETQSQRERERDCCTKYSSKNVSTETNKPQPLLLLFNE